MTHDPQATPGPPLQRENRFSGQNAQRPGGVAPAQFIRRYVRNGYITRKAHLDRGQIQPASLDLRLGDYAYRVRASFLPGSRTVTGCLKERALHRIDLRDDAVLETGCVYIAELLEGLELPAAISAGANPKSSTGRLDVFTRLITDYGREFDKVEAGYHGPLFAEISPRTFPVLVRRGSRLSQLRFRTGETASDDGDLMKLLAGKTLPPGVKQHRQAPHGMASLFPEPRIARGLLLSIDLSSRSRDRPVGFRAKRHTGLIDIDRANALDPRDFWEPVWGDPDLILDPDQFFILASKEAVWVPPDHAAEMVPFDPLIGEFRAHYAGFFDPGFGHAEGDGEGARAVLEVRSHEVPFILEDGQIIGRLMYERLAERPDRVYGQGRLGSHYQRQGLKLSKHFKRFIL